MSGSNRGKGIAPLEALFCVLALLGLASVIYATGRTLGVDTGRSEVIAREHYEREKQNALNACSNGKVLASVECVTKAIESAQNKSETQQGLFAQQDSARWAFWSMMGAWVALGVTVVGVWFVKRTLDATWDALQEARDGTTAALIAAEAGRRANEISEKLGVAQTRPYLVFTEANFLGHSKDGKALVEITVKNSGVSPANEISFFGQSVVEKFEPVFETLDPDLENFRKQHWSRELNSVRYTTGNLGLLAGGEHQKITIEAEVPVADEAVKILTGETDWSLLVLLVYHDMLGINGSEWRKTYGGFRCRIQNGKPQKELEAIPSYSLVR